MKSIPNFPGYFADEFGHIYSIHKVGRGIDITLKPHLLKPTKKSDGYLWVNLHSNYRQFSRPIHRLMLMTFVGLCPSNMVACHNNGICIDNRLINLRWDTRKNNEADKKLHGKISNTRKRLNQLQVRIIRRCFFLGLNRRFIADIFGISRTLVLLIGNQTLWKRIT